MIAPFPLPDLVLWAIPGFIALLAAEVAAIRFGARGRYQLKDAAASLTMGLGNLASKWMFGAIAVAAFATAYQYRLFELDYSWPVFVACFFAEDLSYYWFHRISHERRWFWASHVVHHSSAHYNLSTALRQSWTGLLGLTWLFWLPLILIGFPPAMVAFFSSLSLVYQFWIHTETIERLGPLEWVLNTPSHHRVHHAVNPRYLDANYAGVLIIWDRMFGTFVAERAEDPPRYGIIHPLQSFNPIRIAFHEWAGLARDVWSAKNWRARFGYLFGPPGWSPDGARLTSAALKAQWRANSDS